MVGISGLVQKGLSRASARLENALQRTDSATEKPSLPHRPSIGSTGALGEEEAALPVPPAVFPSLLSKDTKTPARELVGPYLGYETALRKAFAADTSGIGDRANLVPVYDGHESSFVIRTVDREKGDGEKYLMPLRDQEREDEGSLAIAPSLEEYKKNVDAFTHGVLSGIDWSNVVAAGSSALLPLLSKRKDVSLDLDPSVDDPREAYYEVTANTSDIDLFIYGLDSEEAAIKRILELEAVVRKNQRLAPGTGLTLRSEHAITIISPKYPHRHIQIILRLYKSISEILTGFDVDSSCVAFDGTQVYTTPRGVTAITTRTNNIDLTRRSPSYENRLYKYRHHNFEGYWDGLERSRISDDYFNHESLGLARLLYFEEWLRELARRSWISRVDRYRTHRYKRRITDVADLGLVHASGYATHELLFGARCTAAKVRDHVMENPNREPCMFGTLDEVIKGDTSGEGKVSGKVTFMSHDPGRQMIGSFHPLTDDDWTKMAYEGTG
ncbi:uncharacterized protein DNG_09898 [Cephalotrichum gorgonifer]|uniref:Uncharacterized protein n=1 Tax=Cephalotrichum gorgonifer TaxID=2041049 RepID=A0AAE8N804_9PEZI|nr:uncharacterized protein DNG_09898 [Cephalotrichum gorgonifer]